MDDRTYFCSRLSKTLGEILADKGALGYFIQFMDRRGSLALIKFWMEVECTCGPCVTDDNTTLYPDSKNYKLRSTELLNKDFSQFGQDQFNVDVVNSNETDPNVNQVMKNSRRISLRQPVSTIKQDAFRIYNKYITNDSSLANGISDQVKDDIEKSLKCDNIQPLISCLKTVQASVYKTLEDEYVNDFLRSEFHCKHQIDVLTSGDVKLSDILYNETAFFYFMEFMELENKRELLDFWMTAVNYKQNLLEKNVSLDPSEAQTDALIIYDKYFSLQATMPLGFSDKIRFQVEQNICREGGDGPQPDCFDHPCIIVYNFLSKHYLPAFLSSQLYYKYLSELIGTIQSSACTGLQQTRVRRAGSDCSSEISSFSTQETNMSGHIETNRTDNENTRNNNGSMSIDTRQLYDPDSLWKRAKSTLSVGYVDDMGRFVTEIEPDPRRKYESRLTRAVKRFIHVEQDKAKEELAWKIAEMIVREITSLTLGDRDVST
ncbi:A-kinase anchor protein 10, mitochondrial isoform X2 [Venturia canescens]|nr:A-kinase anchor protein 10, mitochondrial isoform X2 [Venturia canescens]